MTIGWPARSGRGPRGSRGCRRAFTSGRRTTMSRSEEHTSELQSLTNLVCRLLLEKKTATFALGARFGDDHQTRVLLRTPALVAIRVVCCAPEDPPHVLDHVAVVLVFFFLMNAAPPEFTPFPPPAPFPN